MELAERERGMSSILDMGDTSPSHGTRQAWGDAGGALEKARAKRNGWPASSGAELGRSSRRLSLDDAAASWAEGGIVAERGGRLRTGTSGERWANAAARCAELEDRLTWARLLVRPKRSAPTRRCGCWQELRETAETAGRTGRPHRERWLLRALAL